MIKKIITLKDKDGESILSKPCKEVKDLDECKEVVRDLLDTAINTKGKAIGLASNQIGSNLRAVVIKYRNTWVPMINPVIIDQSEETVRSDEKCLSRPCSPPITVQRNKTVTVKSTRPSGAVKILKLKGIEAICIQHEIDHLNGVLI